MEYIRWNIHMGRVRHNIMLEEAIWKKLKQIGKDQHTSVSKLIEHAIGETYKDKLEELTLELERVCNEINKLEVKREKLREEIKKKKKK